MKFIVPRAGAAALAAALFALMGSSVARAQAPDSLTLQAPRELKPWSVYNPQLKRFQVYLSWRDNDDAISAYVTPPDTTGWSIKYPASEMTVPTVVGPYNGEIDRTVAVHATRDGEVGVDSLVVTFEVRNEEHFSGRVNIGKSYVPGTLVPMLFRDNRVPSAPTVDFGLKITFSAGKMNNQGGFIVGLEDFEGFHIWRGIEPDGRDLQIIGELSKEEAFLGDAPGGAFVDSVYYYEIIPALRATGTWISPYGNIECLGTRLDIDLAPDGYFWFDCNAVNGFTYYYAVTTFDRGYSLTAGAQGLIKRDNCDVTEGHPYPCAGLERLDLAVDAQNNLYNVYVVPNPVRTGTSRLTTDNYHNFPDGLVRFVNVPANCRIKIFTIAGDLVWMNDHTNGTGNVEWDTRNLEEQEVASGVYMYRIESSNDSVFGRIVVIR